MSSTLSRPKAPESVALPRAIPAQAEHTENLSDEAEFASFVRAIAIGVMIGVPVVAVVIAAIVKFTAPDMELISIAAIAAWVAIWIGVFLGGTVTVGMWSSRQHRVAEPG